jgi:hypothetical protein
MHVSRFEKVSDETVDWETSFEPPAEDLEARESFGKGKEAGAKTHCHGFGLGFDGFVGDIFPGQLKIV